MEIDRLQLLVSASIHKETLVLPNHGHNGRPPHKPLYRKLLAKMHACLPNNSSNVQKGADALGNYDQGFAQTCSSVLRHCEIALRVQYCRLFGKGINAKVGKEAWKCELVSRTYWVSWLSPPYLSPRSKLWPTVTSARNSG